MSFVERRFYDLRCDGCGKVSTLFASETALARRRMAAAGWTAWKLRNKVHDACSAQCRPGDGYKRMKMP